MAFGLVALLSGCLGETGGKIGFLSSRGAKPAEAAPAVPAAMAEEATGSKATAGRRPWLGLKPRLTPAAAPASVRDLALAGGKVVVVAPRGYCLDSRSTRQGPGGGFALIAACNSLAGAFSNADVEPAVMTVQVQPGLLTRDLPGAATLAAASGPARLLHGVDGDGLTLAHLDGGGDAGLPAGDSRHWRGALLINGYLVGLALYAPKGSALAGPAGGALIQDLAESMLDASPIPDFTPAAKVPAAKTN